VKTPSTGQRLGFGYSSARHMNTLDGQSPIRHTDVAVAALEMLPQACLIRLSKDFNALHIQNQHSSAHTAECAAGSFLRWMPPCRCRQGSSDKIILCGRTEFCFFDCSAGRQLSLRSIIFPSKLFRSIQELLSSSPSQYSSSGGRRS
jgi:hypothetical protein